MKMNDLIIKNINYFMSEYKHNLFTLIDNQLLLKECRLYHNGGIERLSPKMIDDFFIENPLIYDRVEKHNKKVKVNIMNKEEILNELRKEELKQKNKNKPFVYDWKDHWKLIKNGKNTLI